MQTVVVLGTDTPIGLNVVRELGKAGYEVVGIGRSERSVGNVSRYCSQPLKRASGEVPLIDQLIVLGSHKTQPCLLSIGEADINLVNRHREELNKHFTLLDPDSAAMERVLNKSKTIAVAEQLGIDTPKTVTVDSVSSLMDCIHDLSFPVVLKWSNPHAVIEKLAEYGISPRKLEYCLTEQDLMSALSRFEPAGVFPLIQEYCSGHGLGQFFLCKKGECFMEFQHERVNEWPPEGGSSTLCRSVSTNQHSECMERSRQLLRALEWDGVAMVEYRYEPRSKRYTLMEINGRFWGSFPLAYYCGAGMAAGLVELFGQDKAPSMGNAHPDLFCRYMIPDTKRLLRVLLSQEKIADPNYHASRFHEVLFFFLRFFSPKQRYYVFEFNDPMPFLRDMENVVRKIVRRMTARLWTSYR